MEPSRPMGKRERTYFSLTRPLATLSPIWGEGAALNSRLYRSLASWKCLAIADISLFPARRRRGVMGLSDFNVQPMYPSAANTPPIPPENKDIAETCKCKSVAPTAPDHQVRNPTIIKTP